MRLLLLLLIAQIGFGQSVEIQTDVLSRKPVTIANSYKDFKRVIEENRVDYIMVTNVDDVNVFYYQNGDVHIIKPFETDVFLTLRDSEGKVIEYPLLFFDRSSFDRKVFFRIGICDDCKNSTIGARYGFVH